MWQKKILCTDPTDWGVFEAAARECYGYIDTPWHNIVTRVGSPVAVSFTAPIVALIRAGSLVLLTGRLSHRLDQLRQPLQVGLRDPGRRIFRRDGFQCRSDGIDLDEIFHRHLPDDRTAERRARDKSEQLQIAQRFPYRALADVELPGPADYHDTIAWCTDAGEDLVHQPIPDFFTEDAADRGAPSAPELHHVTGREGTHSNGGGMVARNGETPRLIFPRLSSVSTSIQ
jgi:hypothetical protein